MSDERDDGGPLPALPARDPAGHKGTFGTAAIVGGCCGAGVRMIGAPALAARAALRAGVGLVRLVMPDPILDAGLTIAPWATGVPLAVDGAGDVIGHEAAAVIDGVVGACDCLAIGPGLGSGDGVRAATMRAIGQEEVPVVVDADAINAMAQMPQVSRDLRASAVLTPHPGEFRRLTEGMGLRSHCGLAESRVGAASELARRLGVVVVLKGAGTVVSDGTRAWVNDTGHHCLATAGTGDVLTGLLSGVIAQFVAPPPPVALPMRLPAPPGRPLDLFDAARIAVRLHGLASERWSSGHGGGAGMLATELADEAGLVLTEERSGGSVQ